MKRTMQGSNGNKFNIKYANDYTKLGKRRRLSTMVRDDLLTDFEEISDLTKYPLSRMLDVLLIEMMKSEESVHEFLNKVRLY
jgi:hypothetical protein